jgi:hypothetical protein
MADTPQLTHVNVVRFYDPIIDADAARFSGFSDRGAEYWVREALAPAGKSRRLQRERVWEGIKAAIEAGLEPGEVIIG